jgi:hypothetical protein
MITHSCLFNVTENTLLYHYLDVNCDILLVTQLRPSALRVLPLLHVHIPLMHPGVMTHEELVMFAQSASCRHSFTPANVIVHIRHQ